MESLSLSLSLSQNLYVRVFAICVYCAFGIFAVVVVGVFEANTKKGKVVANKESSKR